MTCSGKAVFAVEAQASLLAVNFGGQRELPCRDRDLFCATELFEKTLLNGPYRFRS